MKRNVFKGLEISQLGFGMMRLPILDGDYSKVDLDLTARMFETAIAAGVNYFDTAWAYHNGKSESAAGEILSKYPRASYFLANKFPGYDASSYAKIEEIFEEQLKKCKTDYFDFYLMHNVDNADIDNYLNDAKYGHFSYFKEQRGKGRIRHLGFSTHGSLETMRRFLDRYAEDLEFCQIQLNWFDWSFQQAGEKVKMLKEYGLPVWVMEPLRGGRLANLSDEDAAFLAEKRPGSVPADWAFNYLRTIPEVTVILSGMSTPEVLASNLNCFSNTDPLDAGELEALKVVADRLTGSKTIPCTGCRYCVSHCPMGIEIPKMLTLCSELKMKGNDYYIRNELDLIPPDKRSDNCIACRSCEEVCPQHIKISEEFAAFKPNI